jgi:hypothetical protein
MKENLNKTNVRKLHFYFKTQDYKITVKCRIKN